MARFFSNLINLVIYCFFADNEALEEDRMAKVRVVSGQRISQRIVFFIEKSIHELPEVEPDAIEHVQWCW